MGPEKKVRNTASAFSPFIDSTACHSGYPLYSADESSVESEIIESHASAKNQEIIRRDISSGEADLYRPMTGTLVLPREDAYVRSIFSGELLRAPYLFQDDKFAIEILTDRDFVVRYALLDIENKRLKVNASWYKKFKAGTRLNRGDIIGAASGFDKLNNTKRAFLIEMFDNSSKGSLTKSSTPLRRRSDLIRSFPSVKSLSGCI
jgi:hypothetical protein